MNLLQQHLDLLISVIHELNPIIISIHILSD